MSLVPEVERKIIGRWISVRASRSAGLLFKSNPYGMLPPSSPTSSGLVSFAASGTAASSDGTGKHLRPRATAVTAVVVALMTSTATIAQPFRYDTRLSGKQSITTVFRIISSYLLVSDAGRAGRRL